MPTFFSSDFILVIYQEKIKVVTIDGYKDVAESENALLCAVVQQPISVGIDGSSLDFQLYTGVSRLQQTLLCIYYATFLSIESYPDK